MTNNTGQLETTEFYSLIVLKPVVCRIVLLETLWSEASLPSSVWQLLATLGSYTCYRLCGHVAFFPLYLLYGAEDHLEILNPTTTPSAGIRGVHPHTHLLSSFYGRLGTRCVDQAGSNSKNRTALSLLSAGFKACRTIAGLVSLLFLEDLGLTLIWHNLPLTNYICKIRSPLQAIGGDELEKEHC